VGRRWPNLSARRAVLLPSFRLLVVASAACSVKRSGRPGGAATLGESDLVLLEKAFLRDISANPEDDAPRLIFADWLEEQGDAARAEFSRASPPPTRRTPS
jgi:uncharacterized protein (TIGR02996 family)